MIGGAEAEAHLRREKSCGVNVDYIPYVSKMCTFKMSFVVVLLNIFFPVRTVTIAYYLTDVICEIFIYLFCTLG